MEQTSASNALTSIGLVSFLQEVTLYHFNGNAILAKLQQPNELLTRSVRQRVPMIDVDNWAMSGFLAAEK